MEIHCHCGTAINPPWKEEMELNEEVMKDILEGSFLEISCPDCHTVLKPEVKILLKDKDSRIQWIPEVSRLSYLTGSEGIDPQATDVAIGYRELQELIRLRQSQLDRALIEGIKYQILKKVEEDQEVNVFFEKQKEHELVFHLEGLKEGEVGILRIPLQVYTKMAADRPSLEKEYPYTLIFQGPYPSVHNLIKGENG